MDVHSIKGSIEIEASPATVWEVLTNPDKIILYIGSTTITDWKVGSKIIWKGEHGGKQYQDKGVVLQHEMNEVLRFSYQNSFSGETQTEDNFSVITYQLTSLPNGKTEFIYSRENIPTIEEKTVFEGHLPFMLEEIKKLAEG